MKAYHILLFLFIFNMFFWVVTEGIAIYTAPGSVEQEFNISENKTVSSWNDTLGLVGKLFLFGDLSISVFGVELGMVASIATLAGILMIAAMAGYITAGQAPQGVVYGLFSYFFWSGMAHTFTVFINMFNSFPEVKDGALYVMAIFGMIIAIIFVAGLFQMVTGGWKSYE